jgi:hypothetical protein
MSHIKSFEGFLSESLLGMRIFNSMFNGKKYAKKNDIEYQGFIIPVWKDTTTGEIWHGHPRPLGEPRPIMPEYLLYKSNKLMGLKKAIDAMVKKMKGGKIDWKDYQSATTGGDLSGTPVPNIFPNVDKKAKASDFE